MPYIRPPDTYVLQEVSRRSQQIAGVPDQSSIYPTPTKLKDGSPKSHRCFIARPDGNDGRPADGNGRLAEGSSPQVVSGIGWIPTPSLRRLSALARLHRVVVPTSSTSCGAGISMICCTGRWTRRSWSAHVQRMVSCVGPSDSV